MTRIYTAVKCKVNTGVSVYIVVRRRYITIDAFI